MKIDRRPIDPARLARLVALPPVLARAYAARGIDDPSQLSHGLERLLPVGTLEGVDAAVALLLEHRARGRLVLVVGDFDADGATSSALIVRALRAFGFPQVDFLVPNRFEYGYGLSPEIVALAAQRAPGLIVTVDNGIAAREALLRAQQLEMDVVVTDHHTLPAEHPPYLALLHPACTPEGSPYRGLAGVGLAYVLAVALAKAVITPDTPAGLLAGLTATVPA